MKNRSFWALAAILFLGGFLSRYLLSIDHFSSPDSVKYALGVLNFSTANHTPPPPGYFLYVMAGRFVNVFLHDPQQALVLVNAIYSGLLALLLLVFGTELMGLMAGIAASLLFLSSPSLWFKGITIYGYINTGFFLVLMAYFSFKTIKSHSKFFYWTSLAYALCIGVRPQEAPIPFLLYLFTMFHVPFRVLWRGLLVFGGTCAAWFVPMVLMDGGLNAYLSVLKKGSTYLHQDSVVGGQILQKINNHFVRMKMDIERVLFLGLLPLIYGFGHVFSVSRLRTDKRAQVLFLFVVPSFLFNFFVLYAEIGHGMSWALGSILIAGFGLSRFARDVGRFKHGAFVGALACVIGVNITLFFHDFNFDTFDYTKEISDQRQFNFADARKTDRHLTEKIAYIRNHFKESELMILSKEFHRQIMYSLPSAIVFRPEPAYKRQKTTFEYCQNHRCVWRNEPGNIRVPEGRKHVIVFDDPLMKYVRTSYAKKRFKIGDQKSILAVSTDLAKRIDLDYQSITIN